MNHSQRLALAKRALWGTSIGDAFGESFFGDRNEMIHHIEQRTIPQTSWEFTDDTVMAIAVFEQLEKHQTIIQDDLALQFSLNHDKDVNRGYGATARRILREIGEGADWKVLSQSVFEGMGSLGNGASMRVCSIGAYFFDDLEKVKDLAAKSAEVTHTHLEGITGAIAVAVATALATQFRVEGKSISPEEFIKKVLKELPDSDTKSKINKSLSVAYSYNIESVAAILGNGIKISAPDTVPFAIWCAAWNLANYEEALWKAVSILGDRDTICAIVGGITIMSAKDYSISKTWSNAVEDFEKSIFRN
ncbi:ADP-ribosylglycohydrolase family protein [Chondrinema litorale]|uniref:ADP-ribosylglycohydrolase family protein n=1 Tax=Chondrinema litorale TaxID=2994555 RepID=UPI0025433904|nr:ADP-ribosylglycohydrolase family protein [Chondrinema litorale]UZR94977.1 ADP-ribosylglycohydrolase family protein [Chondrinema litorale]